MLLVQYLREKLGSLSRHRIQEMLARALEDRVVHSLITNGGAYGLYRASLNVTAGMSSEDATIVAASRFCWRVIDQGLIDGVVNMVGWISKGAGWTISLFQTGKVNTYAFALVVGALLLLGSFVAL